MATDFAVEVVNAGDSVTVGPFALRSVGTTHAIIHSSYPLVDNVVVLVNDELYYAVDSFANARITSVTTECGGEFVPLEPGDELDL